MKKKVFWTIEDINSMVGWAMENGYGANGQSNSKAIDLLLQAQDKVLPHSKHRGISAFYGADSPVRVALSNAWAGYQEFLKVEAKKPKPVVVPIVPVVEVLPSVPDMDAFLDQLAEKIASKLLTGNFPDLLAEKVLEKLTAPTKVPVQEVEPVQAVEVTIDSPASVDLFKKPKILVIGPAGKQKTQLRHALHTLTDLTIVESGDGVGAAQRQEGVFEGVVHWTRFSNHLHIRHKNLLRIPTGGIGTLTKGIESMAKDLRPRAII